MSEQSCQQQDPTLASSGRLRLYAMTLTVAAAMSRATIQFVLLSVPVAMSRHAHQWFPVPSNASRVCRARRVAKFS